MPRIVTVELESTTPYSQSRRHETPKLPKESNDAHETRTWREKCTTDRAGNVVIPAMAFKQGIDEAAKRASDKIDGKARQTYSKLFMSGVICEADVPIGVHKDEIDFIRIAVNSRGMRGASLDVFRNFPQVLEWKSTATFAILDDEIPNDLFEKYLTEAGRFIGIGRFRPQKGGLLGRYRPISFNYETV